MLLQLDNVSHKGHPPQDSRYDIWNLEVGVPCVVKGPAGTAAEQSVYGEGRREQSSNGPSPY